MENTAHLFIELYETVMTRDIEWVDYCNHSWMHTLQKVYIRLLIKRIIKKHFKKWKNM